METYNSIEVTRQLVKDGKISQEIAETIFPELKESDDERIRKIMLQELKGTTDSIILTPQKRKRWIAWLENQCSQNLANSEKTCKVEPKFKVGDWVVYNDDICQIVKREEGCNKLVTNFGIEKELVNERNLSTARLWTIQDAKDGDVLCYKDEISLYKHDIKNCTKQETTFGGFVYHCCYDGERFITDSLYSLTEQDKMDIHPATQEQRDFLFQKMKDAGYE